MPSALPPFLIIATIKTATKTAQDRVSLGGPLLQ
jgi:hypothetical protein